MGNSNSNARGSASSAAASSNSAVVCYYELLGIALTATPEEIKKAYRSKALQLHPDKNMHRVQEATEMFAKIQNAYQVLSDPQERAFYDRHRESILRKGKQQQKNKETGYSVDDLMAFFDTSVFKGYGDDPKGFYSVYRDLFAFLEDLEAEESDHPARYEFTSFGSKNTPFEPSLKAFYDKFIHFTSLRSFYEADNYDDNYAENRRHRRAISKENQKFRDAMRREYTDTVRNLAAWVRKRDPRWQAYQKERTAQRLQFESKRKEDVLRKRADMAENYVAPDWTLNDQCIDDEEFLLQQLNRLAFEELGSNSEIVEDQNDSDSEEFDDFYCVVCKKVFKNHKQWKNHEQSKKHRTNMQKAGFVMESDEEQSDEDIEDIEGIDVYEDLHEDMPEEDSRDNSGNDESSDVNDDDTLSDISDDDNCTIPSNNPVNPQEIGQKPPKKKVRQPKQQKSTAPSASKPKKKEKSSSKQPAASSSTLKCTVCSQSFESRNKLFRHIEETGHAALKKKK